jgi:hypothetical protein
MVHEALGHGIAAWLTGDRILSLSTVAVQNATASRFVSAAGTLANCIAGAFSLLLLRSAKSLRTSTYFLWIFGAFNLLNSGYLVASALTNSGDWANVIAGLSPPWLWRCVVGIVGVVFYVFSIRWAASSMIRLAGASAEADVRRLVWPAYLLSGIVMTVAAVFNPISPSFILFSGAGPSFGLNSGLLFLPAMIADYRRAETPASPRIPFSFLWLVLAAVLSGIFVAVLGPGVRFTSP